MASIAKNITHAAERKIFSVAIESFLKNLNKKEDRTEAYLKLVDAAGKFWKDSKKETLDKVRSAILDPNNRWLKFVNRVIDETKLMALPGGRRIVRVFKKLRLL